MKLLAKVEAVIFRQSVQLHRKVSISPGFVVGWLFAAEKRGEK